MNLAMESVSYSANGTEILRDVTVECGNGDLVGLIGPNGSGKSTTLRCMMGLRTPSTGSVRIQNQPLESFSRSEIARLIGFIGQQTSVNFDFSVREVVTMGRSPHKSWLDSDTEKDRAIVEEVIEEVGLTDLVERDFRTLSGGEQQRTLIARCLAQQADILLLDEPTNHLDVQYQLDILDLLDHLDVSVTLAIHDLNLAAQYCDRLYLLNDGQVIEKGPPTGVLTEDRVEEVFKRPVRTGQHPVNDRPHLYFISSPNKDRR